MFGEKLVKSLSVALVIAVLPAVVLVSAGPSYGAIILPNDDTYLNQSASTTVQDAPTNPLGTIVMKGQTNSQRIGIIEFTLPNVTVTSASFNMLHIKSWAAGVTWQLQVSGKQGSFDENTITYSNASGITTGTTNIGSALTMAGGPTGSQILNPPVWRNVDMTSFFNANKGTTVVLVLKNTDNATNKGGTIEDREGTFTGNAANAPYVEYVPEPATLVLLTSGLGLVMRRRR